LALCGLLAGGVWHTVQRKVAQHVDLEPLAPLLPQGDKPGDVSSVRSIKADGNGGIVTLSRLTDAWRVQHFSVSFTPTACRDLPVTAVGEISDLAVLPDGVVCMAGLDGRLWRLDADLKPLREKPFKFDKREFRSLDRLADGRLVALDAVGSALVFIGPDGRQTGEAPLPAESAFPQCLAVVPEGLALEEFIGPEVWVRIIGLDGASLRHFLVRGLAASPPDHLAASGGVLLINDSAGPLGVVFISDHGKPLGNTVGVGTAPVTNTGFVAGDPAGGIAYVHFGAGLIKVRLPWPAEAP
jgi:hypothetical protein